ncbi:hypothetical protein B566_EDAN006665 [Ephemera danica]|nr:hypothetical protein B566_EDAN006665 [Ephemera danica]
MLHDKLTCLQVLNMMVFTGFMFNYMVRVNLTIAIVAMVVPSNKTIDPDMMNSTIPHAPPEAVEIEQTRYEWNEHTQNLLLGCFFWGYVLTELPGGRLAEVVGARRVFGYSMLIASLVTLVTPFAASISYIAVVILRIILGFTLGATWPAIQPMASHWIPPMDRSKFIANMMASSLGAAITMPICGFLIASLGWESVFYFTGVVCFLWSSLWLVLIYDTPAEHPRITDEERRYIETALGSSAGNKNKPSKVPWGKMLTSFPVWAIIITHGASVFGYFTVVNQLPTYMKHILNFNIKENGMLSSLPYLGKYLFAICSSVLADYLRRTGKLSTTAARKIFTTFAVMLPGLFMICQVFFGCDRFSSVFLLTAALTVNGTIFGMANTLSSMGGYLSTYMVGSLTNDNQTWAQWRIVFGILACIYCTGSLVFLIFGTGELQEWNNAKKDPKEDGEAQEEMLPVRSKS